MKHKNKAMLIGAIRAGKSTITKALLQHNLPVKKTQTLQYKDWIVDTPGEYTENPYYYKNIMSTALEVTHVLFIQDATKQKVIFPPGFALGIPKLAIGVVTKCDGKDADTSFAMKQLKKVILTGPIVITSSFKDIGLQEIRDLVRCNSLEEMEKYCEDNPSPYVIFHK